MFLPCWGVWRDPEKPTPRKQRGGQARGDTHCTRSRTCGSCCLHTAPPQRSTRPSGTPHTSSLLPSLASCRGKHSQEQGQGSAGLGWGSWSRQWSSSSFPTSHVQRAPPCLQGAQTAGLAMSRIGRTQGASTQQCQLPPRDHGSCLPGAAEIPVLEPWDLTAPVSARKREEAGQCWETALTELPRHLLRSQPCCHPMPRPGGL